MSNICSHGGFMLVSNDSELFVGLGCMLAWFGLVKYMDYSKNYSIMGKTLSFSMPNVIRTLISTIPFMLGYAFLGTCLFWKSNRFQSVSDSLFLLYGLMNGDIIYDTFDDIKDKYFLAQIYLYSFLFFSICVI